MPGEIIFNGRDLRELGVRVTAADGWRSALARQFPVAEVPARDDAVSLSDRALTLPRRIVATGWQEAESVQELRSLRDELAWLLSLEDSTFSVVDAPDRFLRANVVSLDMPPLGPAFVHTSQRISFVVEARDPRWYSTEETVVALSAAPAACPVGSAPVRPVVTISGPADSPELVLRTSGGVELTRLSFAGYSIAGGASLVVDCERLTIRDGSGANGAAALNSGRFPRLRRDAASLDGSPRLSLTSGAGSARYRRAWL